RARPRSWWRKQIPTSGVPASRIPRTAATGVSAVDGSPGPLLKKTPSGRCARISFAVAAAGSTVTLQPRSARRRDVVDVMPRSTATTWKRGFLPAGGRTSYGALVPTKDLVRGLGADLGHQVGTGHGGLFPHPIEQCPRVGLDGADCRTHDALVPQVTGEGTGSCESDPDHALAAHLLGQGTLGTPVGGDSGRFSNDEPGHPDTSGLGILAVDAGVADVRRGHHHDLSVVGGVGECLLVTGHTGVEDRFSEGLAGGSEGAAMEGPAVLEHQDRGAARFLGHVVTLHRARSVLAICCCVHLIRPSRTVGVPRRNVARTRPGRVMPRKGV